jgi:hypothetical protein
VAGAEDLIAKLARQISGPATAAQAALGKIDAQIAREVAALGNLGEKIAAAREKMAALNAAGAQARADGITKQAAAVEGLGERLAAAKARMAELAASGNNSKEFPLLMYQAKASVAGLEQKLGTAKQKLEELQKASPTDSKAIEAQKNAIAGLEKKAAEAQKNVGVLQVGRGQFANAAEEERILTKKKALTKVLSNEQINLASAAQTAGGPLGALGSKVKEVSEVMGQAGSKAGGLAIIASNFLLSALSRLAEMALAAAAAMAALAAAVTLYALHAADAARSSRLLNEAAAAGAKDHGELTMVINDIATRVPLAKDKIAEFGRALEVAGLHGRRMQIALEAVSMIESAIPGAGAKIAELAERFQKLRRAVLTKQDLQGTGLVLDDVAKSLAKLTNTSVAAAKAALQNGTASIDAVMKAMQAAIETKFGKTIAAQMLALSTQFEKLKENIAALFGDLNLEKFLAGLKTVTDLFSQTTVTGRVLKSTMTLIFQGVFDSLAKVMPYVRSFFLGFMIGALQVYIAIKPLIKEMGQLLGAGKGDGLHKALFLGATLAHALGFGLKLVLLAVLQVIEVAKILSAAWDWISGVADELQKIPDVLQNLATTGMSAAGGLVEGFVQGIQAKIGDVIAAVSSMGDAAEGALRAALGWHSPATLGIDAATAVGEGVEVGAGKAEGKTSDAMGSLVNPKSIKAGAKGAKSAGKVVYIENLTVGSKEAYAEFVAMLRREFEVEELGGEPA